MQQKDAKKEKWQEKRMKMQIAVFTETGLQLTERIKLCKLKNIEEVLFQDFRSGSEKERFSEPKEDMGPPESEERRKISLRDWTKEAFIEKNALLFIGACGIAVRSIAPFVKSKLTDPPVLVMDERGQFVIPLLSSHIGGAGKLAQELAELTGGTAVMTTASDVNHVFAVDVFAKENGLLITDMQKAKEVAAAAVAGKEIDLYYPEKDKRIEAALNQITLAGENSLHKIKYRGLWPDGTDIMEHEADNPQESDSRGSDSRESDSRGSDSRESDSRGSDSRGSDSWGSIKGESGKEGSGKEGNSKEGSSIPAVIISPAAHVEETALKGIDYCNMNAKSAFIASGKSNLRYDTESTLACGTVNYLQLIPRNIILGMGCKKGKSAEELLAFIKEVLSGMRILMEAVCCIASIDQKKEEEGILQAAKDLRVPFQVFSAQELDRQTGDFSSSVFVKEKMGVDNVCERAAVAAGAEELLKKKTTKDGMTLAVGIDWNREAALLHKRERR